MALPLLMLIPWNPPAPPAPPSNPWVRPSSTNLWDLLAVTDKVDTLSVGYIKDAFGADIVLSDLIDLLNRFLNNTLSDNELVRVIQMGSYFARNKLKLTLAADNLDHWLVAGSLPQPAALVMKHDVIMDLDRVIDTLCDEHYEAIRAGINSRLAAPAGAKFPTSGATITGPMGKPIAVVPAESPLSAGGEETLYKDSSTRTTDSSLSDIFNAVNAVNLVSQVHVKSEALDTGGWQVTIVDWQVWFYDSYDWNLGGQSVHISLDLFEKNPVIAPFQSTIEDALKRQGVDLSVLKEIVVTDAQMSKIEGKQITVNGRTFQPKAYPIYSDESWHFDPSTCGLDTVLTIPPP